MQNSNLKAEKFQEFLTANQIACFGVQELDDEMQTVIFRTNLEVNGQRLPVMFFVDNAIHAVIQVRVVPEAIRETNRPTMLDYVNELNSTYKSFKYFISADNALILDTCLTAVPEQFDPQLVNLTLDVILQHLTAQYPAIMRKIWAEDVPN